MEFFELRHGDNVAWINPQHIVLVKANPSSEARETLVCLTGQHVIDERDPEQLLFDLRLATRPT